MIPPNDRFYLPSHQWLQLDGENCWRIGITPFAAEQLGDIVFVDLPEREVAVDQGETLFIVESVKTASEVTAPVALTVLDTNAHLRDHPEWLNDNPLAHWIVLFRADTPIDSTLLLTADAYQQLIATES
ncbi:glycine cleavage system protein GcvH [Hydrogenophilus islandicus]